MGIAAEYDHQVDVTGELIVDQRGLLTGDIDAPLRSLMMTGSFAVMDARILEMLGIEPTRAQRFSVSAHRVVWRATPRVVTRNLFGAYIPRADPVKPNVPVPERTSSQSPHLESQIWPQCI